METITKTSIYWTIQPQFAYENPYNYDQQKIFVSEATGTLSNYIEKFDLLQIKFSKNARSKEYAVWLLQYNALMSLIDCIDLLVERKHVTASSLFREIFETLGISLFLYDNANNKYLHKWFSNEIITHKYYRDYCKKQLKDISNLQTRYKEFSSFTHRSYNALLKSCSLGGNNLEMIVFDGYKGRSSTSSVSLVLPHTISAYYSVVAGLIECFEESVKITDIIDSICN